MWLLFFIFSIYTWSIEIDTSTYASESGLVNDSVETSDF